MDKNGVQRASLHPFWNEVSLHIMKYFTCEVQISIVYGYHFHLLTELRHKMDFPTEKKLRIPYFLLHLLIECRKKLKEGTLDQLAHHGLIKLLVEDALHTHTIPLSCDIFCNMSKDDDIWILAKELTSSSSEEKEHIEAERKNNVKEAKGKKTQGKIAQEKKEKGQATEAKVVGRVKAQTPREKWLQTQAERTEKVKTSEGTCKETIENVKEKAPPTKQAKLVKLGSTRSR